jgi:hypothetical protein
MAFVGGQSQHITLCDPVATRSDRHLVLKIPTGQFFLLNPYTTIFSPQLPSLGLEGNSAPHGMAEIGRSESLLAQSSHSGGRNRPVGRLRIPRRSQMDGREAKYFALNSLIVGWKGAAK